MARDDSQQIARMDVVPPYRRPVPAAALGAIAGALFGVAFGVVASLTHNGPALWTGVAESWGWFAGLGALMALSSALAARRDRHRRPPARPRAALHEREP